MVDWLRDIAMWWTTGVLGVLLYWLPVAFCAVGYVMKSASEYRLDIKRRDTEKYYVPHITVGTLIGRAVITVVPVANMVAGVFDVAPHVFGRFIDWLGNVFSVPLVKPRPKATEREVRAELETETETSGEWCPECGGVCRVG